MNDETLARLFDAHGRRLFRRLLILLGRAEDAEDALQNLFVKLARAPGIECEAAYLDRAALVDAAAVDPFTAEPFRRNAEGHLYSLGPNRKDDGGAKDTDDISWPLRSPD